MTGTSAPTIVDSSSLRTGSSHGGSSSQAGCFPWYGTALNLAVIIGGLGYFIDTYDFFLYNSMRVVSLTQLGLKPDEITSVGIVILNCQIFGALIGSFVWGIMGDKIGRKRGLLGSILIYSLGMTLNAFVHDPLSYGVIRFIIGFGVAGEVGLGATLIAETVSAKLRTYALTFFTVMGVAGVTAAGASLELTTWRNCCLAGGIAGLLLLTLRGFLFESGMFLASAKVNLQRGSLRELFGNRSNLRLYLKCVPLLGANFYVTGILLTLAPEIARATGVLEPIKVNIALGIYFFASMFGDWLGAWLSSKYQTRRKVALGFIAANMCLSLLFLQKLALNAVGFYSLCATFGLFNLWAITATIVVEQFPTRLRATATTSNFNCSRSLVILMNLSFLVLKPIGISLSLIVIGVVVFALGLACAFRLPETYGCTLNDPER